MANHKTLVAIAGPTAGGKTALSIELATHFNTAIVSFDSRQCYAEMQIGVARPSQQELQHVPHYFIASHSVQDPVDAAAYEQFALQKLESLFANHDVVIAVGGTGLYLKALCEGLDAMPAVPDEIRHSLRESYEQKGIAWLQKTLQDADPQYASTGEMQNPHRMLRALEIMTVSGKSIKAFQQQKTDTRQFNTLKIGVELPREILVNRIHQRVDEMMQQGLEAEARNLFPYKHLQALQTVGYQELFEYFEGTISLATAVEKIKTHTRQYAKRQMTWFKKDEDIKWFAPEDSDAIKKYLAAVIAK